MDTNPYGEHLLIDGYNLIRAVPELRREEQTSLERGRQVLERELGSYRRATRAQITIVYDGDGSVDRPPTQERHGVEIVFSQPPYIADDLIKKRLQEKHGAKWMRVITSDREIRRFAQRHKIRSTASEDFAEELAAPPPPLKNRPRANETKPAQPRGQAPDELDRWEELFEQGKREEKAEERLRSQNRELDEWERQFTQGHPDDEEQA